jgi:hypothetical protein
MDTGETRDCSLPPPLTEDEISSAVDGRPPRHARAHLRRCPSCARRVAEARRFESSLSGTLHRFDCPPAQRLGDYTFGMLDDTGAREIMLHLERCSRCAAEVTELRAFMQAESLEAQPDADEAMARVARPRRIRFPRIALDDIIATFSPRSPALAYRGASISREPIVAEAGDLVISLELRPVAAGQVEVTGMLAALDPDRWVGALALLWMEGEVRAAAPLDENGGFTLEPLPPGAATLRITPESGPTVVLAGLQMA